MPRLVQFVAGMGICTIELKLRRPGNRKGEDGIEGADCGRTLISFALHVGQVVPFFSLVTL